MKNPILQAKKRNNVIVTAFDGGINLRDELSDVGNNQLTDCQNMWFRNGVLKTRPGYRESVQEFGGPVEEDKGMKCHKVFSEQGQLCSIATQSITGSSGFYSYVYFFWAGATSTSAAWDWESSQNHSYGMQYNITIVNHFVLQKQNELFLFLRLAKNDETKYEIHKLNMADTSPSWAWLAETDLYAPIVLTNCISDNPVPTRAQVLKSGTQFEGYNLISPYYRMQYSSSNPDKDNISQYRILYKAPVGKVLKVSLNLTGSPVEHTVTVTDSNEITESTAQSDGLKLQLINRERFRFLDGNAVKTFNAADYVPNNMEVTAPFSLSSGKQLRVFHMRLVELFGGGNAGLNGGTVIFLSNNTASGRENLVVWSAPNNPLYFDENCYFFVGNDKTRVTQFAKQEDMLVIFKANEIYYTKFVRNTDIDAEDLQKQSVVDYTANAIYFPLTLLHSTIGCDCPGTVQLCRNRLVWVTSAGRVYSLVNSNVYNERTVYEVGAMIENSLCKNKAADLKKAVSADVFGHYCLFVGNKAYVMDYNSGGYQTPYSFYKEQEANRSIPWYYWTFASGFSAGQCFCFDDSVHLVSVISETNQLYIVTQNVSEEFTSDNGAEIHGMAQTKLFDFLPGYRKNIETVLIKLGNTGNKSIKVTFVTDCGCEEETVLTEGESAAPHTPGYVKTCRFTPCIRAVEQFGVRLECQNDFSVNGLIVQYKILGGVR